MNERIIFEKALDLDDPSQRAAYLEEACGQDVQLRLRLKALLHSHEHARSFLQGAMVDVTANRSQRIDLLGVQIGAYKIREQIGEGGMGVVYVAEQTEPVRRKVALKIIKPGMASEDVIGRFEAERQALAMMEHPNIARVFDAGSTEAGQPYFVMELVQGLPITEYCDQQRLNTRDRLELFLEVCGAVHHAHQKGVIHRDLKPSNVLVPEIDAAAIPKVIDFGVAKAVNQKLSERTVYTQFSQLVGTPTYMSPEQASLGVVDVDTRSDIYSLGVLLYELLTGSTPFDGDSLRQAGYDEMRRIIREEEPRRPSALISTLQAQALSTVAERRGSDPRKLGTTVRGELDWLVMKALEKDRNRRYDTASAMAADIDHFLKDEPVLACPPSVGYRLTKFGRRNRTLIVAGSLIAAALIVGLVSTAWQATRTARALLKAEQSAAESQAVVEFVINEMIQSAKPSVAMGREVTVKDALSYAEESIEESFKDQPLVEARIRQLMGHAYCDFGEYERARLHYKRASELRTRLLGRSHDLTLHSRHMLGRAISLLGRHDESQRLHLEVLDLYCRKYGPEDSKTLPIRHDLVASHLARREYGIAEQEIRKILKAKQESGSNNVLDSMNNLAIVLENQGKLSESEEMWRQVIDQRRDLGPEHPKTLGSMGGLAVVLWKQGRYRESEALYTEIIEAQHRILGSDHPDTLGQISNVGQLHLTQGHYSEAEKQYREALAAYRRTLGSEHPRTFRSMGSLALCLVHLDKFEEARSLAAEALAHVRRLKGPNSLEQLTSQVHLMAALEGLGQLEEARQLREKVLAQCRADDADIGYFLRELALNIALTADAPPNDRQRAIELAEKAVELDPEDNETWRALGCVHAANDRWQESLEAFQRTLDLGYRDQLIPGLLLERVNQSDNQNDESHQRLLEFLQEHATGASVVPNGPSPESEQ